MEDMEFSPIFFALASPDPWLCGLPLGSHLAEEIGAKAALETRGLDHGTLKPRGGLTRALALFGRERLPILLEELNTALAP
jgi:hypothetical protein